MPRVHVSEFDPASLPEGLLPQDVSARWAGVDRSNRSPEVVAIANGASQVGAALVTARAGGAYLKIVDAVGDVPAVLAAVEDLARQRGLVQLKWEGWTARPADAEATGFQALAAPLTGAADGEPANGYVRWLVDAEIAEPPYYRQTETFTCGAVVALMAQTPAGRTAGFDRAAELGLWRSATNFPSCEPVGLAAAVRGAWPDAAVAVSYDVDRPVMIGHLPEPEQEWRAVLQRSARSDAEAAGVITEQRRVPISEVRAALAAGERVLLLLSLSRMQGFDVPHWVLCHGAIPGALVIEDPWTGAATGDTWIDAHLLPIAEAELDAMAAIEEDGYRGVVRIR